MLINGLLNVGIGLVMTFGMISLVTSAITEAIASFLALRSKSLLAGIKQMLNDPKANGLALAVYQHAAVNPLGSGAVPADPARWQQNHGTYQDVSALLGKMPSYINSKGFASALIDAIQNRQQPGGVTDELGTAIGKIADPQLRAVVSGFYERVANDESKLHDRLAAWFDASMDRLSGEYKRNSQRNGLIIAMFIVLLLNIDAVAIAQHIYADPGLVQHFTPASAAGEPNLTPGQALEQWTKTFPFTGWANQAMGPVLLWSVPGWIMTALATLFGAPFWFDTLQRFVQLRGTGPVPNPAKPPA